MSLVQRGILEAIGGRYGQTLYAHRDHAVTNTPAVPDDAELVLQALESAYTRLRRPLSTREVGAEVKRLGLNLGTRHPNGVRQRLATLSRERVRGVPEWNQPRVRFVSETTAAGKPTRLWMPAGARPSGAPAPRSRSDAVRRAVHLAAGELGMPVTRDDLVMWSAANITTSTVASALDPSRLSKDLHNTIKADREHSEEPGRLHRVTTRYTTYAGPPARYSARPPSAEDLVACELLDALWAYRPARELEEIRELEAHADSFDLPALRDFAQLRRDELARAVLDSVRERDQARG